VGQLLRTLTRNLIDG